MFVEFVALQRPLRVVIPNLVAEPVAVPGAVDFGDAALVLREFRELVRWDVILIFYIPPKNVKIYASKPPFVMQPSCEAVAEIFGIQTGSERSHGKRFQRDVW